MTDLTTAPARTTLAARLHDGLVFLLPALRPLICSGGEFSGTAEAILWHGLLLLGFGLCVVEGLEGQRPTWRWAPGGVLGAVLLVLLLPAACHGHVPLEAWALWTTWGSLLLLATYLMQVLPGRQHLLLAGLAAGMAGTAVLAIVQRCYVFPQMEKELKAGRLSSELGAIRPELFVERLRYGGAYGTLQLANLLMYFQLLVGLPVLAAAWWRQRPATPLKCTAIVVGILMIVALVAAGSKGGVVALVLAMAAVGLVQGRGRWRWWPVIPAAGLGLALMLPVIRQSMAESAMVRGGYFEAAWRIALSAPWSGVGLDAFGEHAGLHLTGVGFSRYAHNEVLQAAAVAGLPAALVFLGLLGYWAFGLFRRDDQVPLEKPQAFNPFLPWILVPALPYAVFLGMAVTDNLWWWPEGDWLLVRLFWALALGTMMAIIGQGLRCLPIPPRWALQLALLVGIIGSLIDYAWHDAAVASTLVCLAVLAARPRVWQLTGRNRWWPGLALILLVALWGLAFRRTQQAILGRHLLGLVKAYEGAERDQKGQEAAECLRNIVELVDDRLHPMDNLDQVRLAVVHTAGKRFTAWPAAYREQLEVISLLKDPLLRKEHLELLLAAWPGDSLVWLMMAAACEQIRDYDQGVKAARQSFALSPLVAPRLLIRLLELRSKQLLDPATSKQMVDEAADLRQRWRIPQEPAKTDAPPSTGK